MKIHNFHHRLC